MAPGGGLWMSQCQCNVPGADGGGGGGGEGPWAGLQTSGFEVLKMSIFSPIFPYFFCLTLHGISFLKYLLSFIIRVGELSGLLHST